jgi:hypothetical protein
MVMTNKSLILGVVALCALPAAALAQVPLLSENFDTRMPGTTNFGPFFTGVNAIVRGNILNGAPFQSGPNFCLQSPPPNNCAAFSGFNGSMTSIPVTLEPGNNYLLSYALFGDRTVTTVGNTINALVTLGPVGDPSEFYDQSYTLTQFSTAGVVKNAVILPSVSVPTQAVLIFKGTDPHSGRGSASVDDIVLTEAPEPATLGLLALGLLGGAGAGFVRRKRRS